MTLNFYKTPFYKSKFSGWVWDNKGNFMFQIESKFNDEGNYADGEIELQDKIIESLNSEEHIPLDINLEDKKNGWIYRDGEPFILIRGWGNLTGIGAHNFPVEKAAKIQDDFRNWLMFKLTNK